MKKIDFFRVLFIIFFVFLLVAGISSIKPPQTSILDAILTDSPKDKLLASLSNKYSSRLNVLFESEDSDSLEELKEKFLDGIDKSKFKTNDYGAIFEDYIKYRHNFLTPHSIKLLEEKQYASLEKESLERLYNPMGISLLAANQDPFGLFSEYILSLKGENFGESELIEHSGKFYEYASFDFKDEIAASTTLLNKEMSKIVKLQKKFSRGENKIFLTGAPIHSYTASSKSIVEINLICIISTIFVISLCHYYFRSAKILVPIVASVFFGILCGYLMTSLVFSSIHVLTFVFSTTLIGICLDYSLHYFIEQDLDKIFKSLTISIVTGVAAFCALLFSHIELLKQIAVFTSIGLFSVYALVVLFFPLIKTNFELRERKINFNPDINKNLNKILAVCFACVTFFGLYKIKFNDDVRSMYKPSKELIKAEKLFAEVTQTPANVSFLVMRADDFEQLMQKEEMAAKILNNNNLKYISLSRFIPSENRQKLNQRLIKELYENNKLGLDSYANFLSKEDIKKEKADLRNDTGKVLSFDEVKYPYLKGFLAQNDSSWDSSLMILYNINSAEIFKNIDDATYINPADDITAEMKKYRRDCLKVLLPLSLALFVLLAITHTLKNAVILVLPPILGVMFSFGVLSLLGIDINLFQVLAAFLIIGFSLDYSIFRFNIGKNSNDALFISCITSVFSFFLLSMTSFKLISSLGLTLFIGILTSYILSLFLISDSEPEATAATNSD